jgi:hypothetical protein
MKVITSVGIKVNLQGSQTGIEFTIQNLGEPEEDQIYNFSADIDQLAALKVACTNIAGILGQPLSTCEIGIVTTFVTISGAIVKFGNKTAMSLK